MYKIDKYGRLIPCFDELQENEQQCHDHDDGKETEQLPSRPRRRKIQKRKKITKRKIIRSRCKCDCRCRCCRGKR